MSANGLIPVWRGVYIHYFKINPPHFLLSCLFWKLSQPLGQDKKIANKHTVAYWLSYFYGFLRAFLSRVFLEFSPKFVYSTMVAEKLQVYSAKITANTFANQKIESVHFYSCPQAKLSPRFLSLSSRQTGIAHSSWTAFFEDIFPEEKEGRRLWSWKNYQN